MKNLMLLAVATIAVLSCADYQWSPYVEVQYRDERFSNGSRIDNYGGQTLMLGARAVPPTIIRSMPRDYLRIPAYPPTLVAPGTTQTSVHVNLPEPPEEKSEIEELANLAKDEDGNWTGWGVCALIVLAFAYREFKRPRLEAT